MKYAVTFVAAVLLTACSSDPVDPAVAANDSLAGTTDTAEPVDAEMAWTWRADTNSALFGPDTSRPQLSIECRGGVLHITRHAPVEDAQGTLSFTGERSAASLPVVAAPSELGPGSLSTTALQPGDMTNAVARVFAGKGEVNVTLGGAPSLTTPPSDVPGRAFAACRR